MAPNDQSDITGEPDVLLFLQEDSKMANQIRITPDQMRTRSTQYRNEADTVNGVISKLDSLLQQLQSEWEGEASSACREISGTQARLREGRGADS